MNPKVYSEINSILDMLGKDYIDEIPVDVYERIKNNMDPNYHPYYTVDNINKDLLYPDTIEIIKTFYDKYWNDEEDIIYIINDN